MQCLFQVCIPPGYPFRKLDAKKNAARLHKAVMVLQRPSDVWKTFTFAASPHGGRDPQ